MWGHWFCRLLPAAFSAPTKEALPEAPVRDNWSLPIQPPPLEILPCLWLKRSLSKFSVPVSSGKLSHPLPSVPEGRCSTTLGDTPFFPAGRQSLRVKQNQKAEYRDSSPPPVGCTCFLTHGGAGLSATDKACEGPVSLFFGSNMPQVNSTVRVPIGIVLLLYFGSGVTPECKKSRRVTVRVSELTLGGPSESRGFRRWIYENVIN